MSKLDCLERNSLGSNRGVSHNSSLPPAMHVLGITWLAVPMMFRPCFIVLAVLVLFSAMLPSRAAVAAKPGIACPWKDPALKSQEMQVAYLVWKHNVMRDYGIVRPSGAYSGVWLRDSFWTLTALGDLRASAKALNRFAQSQLPSGQIPTQYKTFVSHPLFFADESTLLFVIWADWQAQNGGTIPHATALFRALKYIRARASGGLYMSGPGTYNSWFDSYRLGHADTLSYNQGLYVDALLAARDLRLNVGAKEMAMAANGYRSLATRHGKYLAYSGLVAFHDISGLVGEFVSLWLFHRPILSDDVVKNTVLSQPRYRSGFRVVTDQLGEYLPERAFVVRVVPGDYQNGASWLLFDYIALATGFLHHMPEAGKLMHDRLVEEFASDVTFHEYLVTNPRSSLVSREPRYRDGFSWDTFVVAIDRVVVQACSGR